jgi:hypothetical protein
MRVQPVRIRVWQRREQHRTQDAEVAVFAPMARARVEMPASENTGDLRSRRKPLRRSW